MRNRLRWSRCLAYLLISFALIGCSSTKNRTEERAKERVIQFIRLMSANQIEEVEKLLSRRLAEDESKELFLDAYDDWQLKDTSVVVEVDAVVFPIENDKNSGAVSITVRNEKLGFTKIVTMPIKFERGDWYIGG
jgi:hypothetical protein